MDKIGVYLKRKYDISSTIVRVMNFYLQFLKIGDQSNDIEDC
jgi:hypothetical protein